LKTFLIIVIILILVLMSRKKKGGKAMLFDRDREVVAAELVDSPLNVTERSLVAKRDRALEKAARRANLTWGDKRSLRKSVSQGLLELTRQTGEDIREALVEKLRSDLNLFVSAHEIKNLATLEKLRMAFEEMLSEASTASARRRAQTKAATLIELVDNISRKHEELERHCKGSERYKLQAEEAFDRIFEDTLRRIEDSHISLRSKRIFTD